MLKDYQEKSYFLRLIGKNSLRLFFINILPAFSSFAVGVLVSRRLGVSSFGEYVTAYNYYNMFYFLPLLGLGVFIIRDLAKDRALVNKYAVNVGFISLVASAACILLICSLALLLKYDSLTRVAIYIISFSIFPNSLILLTQAIFIALGKIRYAFIAALAEVIIKVILSFAVLTSGSGIKSLMTVQVLSKFLGLGISFYFILRCTGSFKLKMDFVFCRKIWQEVALTFVLITMLNNIFTKVDILTLSGIRQMSQVGLYSPASKFVWLGYLFIYATTTALLPVVSRLHAASREMFETGSREFLKYFTAILVPFLIIGFLLSDWFIPACFGERFIDSILAFKMLIWSAFFLGIFSFCDVVLIVANRQRQILYTLGFSLVLSFILNIYLAYKLGYLGTCLAVVLAMAIFATLELFLVSRFIKLHLTAVLGRPLLGLAATGLFLYLSPGGIGRPLLVMLSLVIYFLVLFVLRTFTKNDLLFFKRLYREGLA